MSLLIASERTRLLEFLRSQTSEEIVEFGERLADIGAVRECSKSASTVYGSVQAPESDACTTQLEIRSAREVSCQCSCQPMPEPGMAQPWCGHSAALLLRASELGFLSPDSGFSTQEPNYRINPSSPNDVALVLRDLREDHAGRAIETVPSPHVAIVLDLNSDRLGVQIFFDREPQEPALFEEFRKPSGRALDNLLIRILEEEGAWDEVHKCWFVNNSAGISLVFGILSEYREITALSNNKPIRFSDRVLQARLVVSWTSQGADLKMFWRMPDGKQPQKDQDLLGSGPYWVAIENTIYRVAPSAARMAALFPYAPTLSLSRSQVGPLVEVLQEGFEDAQLLEIHHQELQPASEIQQPIPVFELERKDLDQEHFAKNRRIELSGVLEFEYPTPPQDKNVVYLPNRQKEREFSDYLLSLGFRFLREKRKYEISGDAALDLLKSGKEISPKPWRIVGLDQIRKSIRFSDAQISISLSGHTGGPLESEAESKASRSSSSGTSKDRPDWFDCQVSLVLNNSHVPLSTIFKGNYQDEDRWVRLDSGAFVKVPGGTFGHLKTTLGLLDPNFRLSNKIKARLNTAQAVGLSRFSDPFFSIDADRSLKRLARQLDQFEGINQVKLSKNFKGTLRPYQADGLNWLFFLHEFELGGILADEMGLGKTVQTLSLLLTLRERATRAKKRHKPALVVAPTSVITNWWYEAKRFTPQLKVLLLHGAQRRNLYSQIPEHDLVITSYALLRLDRYELERNSFSYLILDEAQHIKNFQAATTIAAKSLKTDHRLALSGTPTENRPMELWSLMDFLMPGYLGTQEFFRSQFEKPILEGGPGVQVAQFLKMKTKPFILRRVKSDVEKELPPKIESVIHTSMTPEQRELYAHILAEVRPRVFDAVEKKGIPGASVSILAALLRLRQVCNHPNSIEALKDLPGYDSGKFIAFKELLEEALDSGRKILVFGQFREMLSIIRRHLDAQQVSHLYLDGTTRNRQELIDRFNSDDSVRVFLISLKAGGLGLNLASADMVILYDPWWNPAVENQAIDRAHRIGQKRTVYVYRLVTEDSVEQKIMDLKRKKAAIVDALINEQGVSTLALNKGDLENLFSPMPEGS